MGNIFTGPEQGSNTIPEQAENISPKSAPTPSKEIDEVPEIDIAVVESPGPVTQTVTTIRKPMTIKKNAGNNTKRNNTVGNVKKTLNFNNKSNSIVIQQNKTNELNQNTNINAKIIAQEGGRRKAKQIRRKSRKNKKST
jgi:hypothetical protein